MSSPEKKNSPKCNQCNKNVPPGVHGTHPSGTAGSSKNDSPAAGSKAAAAAPASSSSPKGSDRAPARATTSKGGSPKADAPAPAPAAKGGAPTHSVFTATTTGTSLTPAGTPTSTPTATTGTLPGPGGKPASTWTIHHTANEDENEVKQLSTLSHASTIRKHVPPTHTMSFIKARAQRRRKRLIRKATITAAVILLALAIIIALAVYFATKRK